MNNPDKESETRPGYRRHEAEAIDDRQQLADGDTVYEELTRVEEACDQYVQLRRDLGRDSGHESEDVPTVESFAARFPDIESQILELLPTILMMEMARDQHVGKRKDGRVDFGPEQLSQLDDFEIGKELGRGGMGIVCQARQVSLGRQVALKILPRHTLTQKQIAQFQREASTLAKLHHSNIAPIYAVGEKDGVHYFAMQLLAGSSLEHVTDSRELSVEEVVSIGKQVAQALQYAHDQGVFHRDIKPANLILDPDGTVWVTDFGLAATKEHVSGSDDEKTSGTLRYLPPEALVSSSVADSGNSFDLGQADVYSLGITLIELLTGKSAFEATRVKELTQAIKSGEFPPLINGGKPVSRDLEAVLRKAVSVNPQDRYLTAGEFAEDLASFENGIPVKARPLSAISQGLRWAKRNPYLAFASSLAAISMVVTSLVMTISQLQIKDSLTSERRERVRAENASRLGAQSIDRIFNQFASESMFLDEQAGLESGFGGSTSPLSKESAVMLKELSGFYHQLASDDVDSDLPVKSVMARRRVGEIQQSMGDHAAAVESFEDALNVYLRLIENGRVKESAEVVVQLAKIRNQLGHALNVSGESERSVSEHQHSITQLEEYLSEHSSDTKSSDTKSSDTKSSDTKSSDTKSFQLLRLELARSHYLSAFHPRPGMGPNSLPRGARPSTRPSPPWGGRHRSAPRMEGGSLQSLEEAVEILESLQGKFEGKLESVRKFLLAISHREIAPDALIRLTPSDLAHQARAIELLEELNDANQGATIFRLELMKTLAKINVHAPGYKKPEIESAYQSLTQAVGIGAELTKSQPNNIEILLESIHAYAKLARIAGLKSEIPGAEKASLLQEKEQRTRSALLGQSFLAKQHPDSLAYRTWVAYFSLELAQCPTMSNRQSARRRLISRAINTLFQMPEDFRARPEVAKIESDAKRLSGELLVGSGDNTED